MPKGVTEAPATQLRALRIKRKLTLSAVAAAVGISPAGLSFIERGLTTSPREIVGKKIAQFFGKKLPTLLQAI